jgi:desulfoferrodoxin (superoxide reductase-like protein)
MKNQTNDKVKLMNEIHHLVEKLESGAAKSITAAQSVWNDGKHQVSAYPAEAEGSHKEKHIHVEVSGSNEKGNIAINDGRVLNGNLKQKTVNWVRRVILTLENKVRLLQMLLTKTFYRLDRPDEVEKHPIQKKKNSKKASLDWKDWDGKEIVEVQALCPYKLLVAFSDGKIKLCDIENTVFDCPTVYRRMIDHPESIYEVEVSCGGWEVVWDDMMDYPMDGLYERGVDILL